jgi:4-aminobutyrate aminotransferase-like enzyme
MADHRPVGTIRAHDPLASLMLVRGQGDWVWDAEGRRYLDFIGGYSSCIVGHSHPRLIEAACDQLQRITFAHSANSPERKELEKKLSRFFSVSDEPSKVWMTTGGARAVELAWKIASAHRPGSVLRFDRAYHGRSLATACISDTPRSTTIVFGSDLDRTIPFPVSVSRTGEDIDAQCEASLERASDLIGRHHRNLSMLLMEPAIGSRGYYFAPPWFCKRLADLAHSYGLLVVSDEIQMGLGRLGAWSVACADGWKPDLVILGKGLGAGIVSMGVVVGGAPLMDSLPEGIESETYAAAPLACRIGLEVLDILDQEGWVRSAGERGEQWRKDLRAFLPDSIAMGGRGMATVLQFNDRDGEGQKTAREWVVDSSRSGLLLHLTGANRDRLAIIPPLNVSRQAMAESLDILARKASSC